jgi:hypothetical protein
MRAVVEVSADDAQASGERKQDAEAPDLADAPKPLDGFFEKRQCPIVVTVDERDVAEDEQRWAEVLTEFWFVTVERAGGFLGSILGGRQCNVPTSGVLCLHEHPFGRARGAQPAVASLGPVQAWGCERIRRW